MPRDTPCTCVRLLLSCYTVYGYYRNLGPIDTPHKTRASELFREEINLFAIQPTEARALLCVSRQRRFGSARGLLAGRSRYGLRRCCCLAVGRATFDGHRLDECSMAARCGLEGCARRRLPSEWLGRGLNSLGADRWSAEQSGGTLFAWLN